MMSVTDDNLIKGSGGWGGYAAVFGLNGAVNISPVDVSHSRFAEVTLDNEPCEYYNYVILQLCYTFKIHGT